jgi:hypothetical protein
MLTTRHSPPRTRSTSGGLALGLLALLGGFELIAAPAVRAQAQVNDVAPDFTFTNLLPGPATVTLSDYRGSVVVLSAFAYW